MAVTMATTFSYSYNKDRGKQVIKIVSAWNSGDGGEAEDTDGAASDTTELKFSGKIIGLGTIPGAAAKAPDDNYDVVITDSDGHDVLLGAGLNRDTANTEYKDGTVLAGVANSTLTFSVTNAGSDNSGTVILWIDGYVG